MNRLLDGRTLADLSIERLREFQPPEGYRLAFSGGKDSIVLRRLCDLAGVRYAPFYNVTGIDPPDLVQFIRREHPDVAWLRPKRTFLARLPLMGFPMRPRPGGKGGRWCCRELKEAQPTDGVILLGIRWAESGQRKNRRVFEQCYQNPDRQFRNVIIDWKDEDVWQFIRDEKLPYCCLYDEGWKRIGCLFCPNASPAERKMHGVRYPRYEGAFRRAFRKLYERRAAAGRGSVRRWANGDAMFDWWISGDAAPVADDAPEEVLLFG